jgi:hypothetical protein
MSSLKPLLAGLLTGLMLSVAASTVQAESIDRYRQFIVVGQTSQLEIRQLLGAPQETIAADDLAIWVYHDRLEIPMLVSLIPIIGDIADTIELVQNIRNNHELIIQFGPNGIVRKAKLREMD